MKLYGFAILFMIFSLSTYAQNYSNLRTQTITIKNDTIQIDTLSIIPGSAILSAQHKIFSDTLYRFNYAQSMLIVSPKMALDVKQITITYRVFPIDFSSAWYHRKQSDFELAGPVMLKSESELPSSNSNFFTDNQLDKRGSISRGVTIGNNQDAVLNSRLSLQVDGKIGDNMNLLAAISDENIPVQPEGSSQQIQDFDKVFIQLYNEKFKLVAGDFEISRPAGYYMNVNKKAQGGLLNVKFQGKQKTSNVLETTVSGAVSKGKLCLKKFQGRKIS